MHLNRRTILFRSIFFLCVCVCARTCVCLLNLGCIQLLEINHAALQWHSRMAWSRATWKASLRCILSSAVPFLSLILSPLFLYSFICQVRDCQKGEEGTPEETANPVFGSVLCPTLYTPTFSDPASVKVSPCRKVFPGSGFTGGKQL